MTKRRMQYATCLHRLAHACSSLQGLAHMEPVFQTSSLDKPYMQTGKL